ncbi:F-box protein-like protein [Tanacetum coccineum]
MEPSSGHFPSLSMYTEIIAAGSSKQLINDTGDDKSSASANKLESMDDLLIEILLRLPLISLRLFKSVSKRWLSLIADPNFTMLRGRNSNIDPPSGFFLLQPSASSEFAYVALDARIPGTQSPLVATFTFDLDSDYIEVLQACNGIGGLYDVEVATPKTLNGKAYRDDKLLESRGCLLLVKMVQPMSLQMNVYELKIDYSGWSVVYHVNLVDISTSFCGKFEFLPRRYMVRAIVLGEGEEDPFLVVEVPGKLLRYDIISKTYYELCELVPIRPRVTKFCSFLFIASLAGAEISTSFCGKFEFLPKRYMVRAIVLGEGEEDPFLVVEVPGKLLRFLFIASLAGV